MTLLELLILISLYVVSTYLMNRKGYFLGSISSILLIFLTLITYYTDVILINNEYEPIIIIACIYFATVLSMILVPLALFSNYLIRLFMNLKGQDS